MKKYLKRIVAWVLILTMLSVLMPAYVSASGQDNERAEISEIPENSGLNYVMGRPMTEEEDQQIIKQINDSCADFIWVGLGAPKQEIWMAAHQGTVRGFMVGVGAAFDYLAGNIKRAPEWMQKRNMEWFYRFVQDPKRLFRRYFYTNSKFIWHAMIKGR